MVMPEGFLVVWDYSRCQKIWVYCITCVVLFMRGWDSLWKVVIALFERHQKGLNFGFKNEIHFCNLLLHCQTAADSLSGVPCDVVVEAAAGIGSTVGWGLLLSVVRKECDGWCTQALYVLRCRCWTFCLAHLDGGAGHLTFLWDL